jgi:alanine-glyoxylate transaminase/serine-glyoxylate transaminase/serine-pyruvate transaminase
MNPGDAVLMFETGPVRVALASDRPASRPEARVPERAGHDPATGLPWSWRRPAQPDLIEAACARTGRTRSAPSASVHSETSTGTISDIAAVRRAIDAAGHPALLLVDTISGLACADYRHDEWGVDVAMAGSQKGLMMPPGISFNALSPKAIEASKAATLPKAYWAWDEIVEMNKGGYWPSTPNTNLLYALSEALDMMLGQGLAAVFARHQRWGEAVRGAVRAWGLPIQCADASAHSPVLTGVITPAGVDADALRKLIHDRFDLSLGTGLGKVKGRMFRIGHLGDSNDLTLMAALAGVEMGTEARRRRHHRQRRAGGDGILRLASAAANPAGRGLSLILSFSGALMKRRLVLRRAPARPPPSACRAFAPRPGRPRRCASSSAFRPGGGTDALARVLSQKLTGMWGQQVVVETKAGAAGVIAADYVTQVPGDGSTLLMAHINSHALAPSLQPKLRYNAERDFVPIVPGRRHPEPAHRQHGAAGEDGEGHHRPAARPSPGR